MIYEYRCNSCQKKHSRVRDSSESSLPSTCPECGTEARRILSAVRIATDYEAYRCPITDDVIDGRKAHEENLKRHGCRVFEAGERKQWLYEKEMREAMFEKDIEQTIGETISSWPQEKQNKFAQELEHGATAGMIRSGV